MGTLGFPGTNFEFARGHGMQSAIPKTIMFQLANPENNEGDQWRMQQDKNRFLHARNGDLLCAPFQCDWCWFVNMTGRTPHLCSLFYSSIGIEQSTPYLCSLSGPLIRKEQSTPYLCSRCEPPIGNEQSTP